MTPNIGPDLLNEPTALSQATATADRRTISSPSRERLHLIYPEAEPEAAQQARELLSLAATSDPNAAGAWVPARDLARLYREHRKARDLQRLPWTAIARHLKHLAPKKLAKCNGRRRVWYRIPGTEEASGGERGKQQ